MRLPRMSIRGLMFWVAGVALLLFAGLRCDLSALPEHIIWLGDDNADDQVGLVGLCLHWIVRPYLAHWIIPAVTIAVAWPKRNKCVTCLAFGAVVLILASWVVLRRPIYPLVVGPGGLEMWPHYFLSYVRKRLAGDSDWHHPHWPFAFDFMSYQYQKADLLCLIALVFLLVVTLIRRRLLPLRLLAAAALVLNLCKFVDWVSMMSIGRHWGVGESPWQGHSDAVLRWVREGASIPRASWLELAEGPLMIAVICYLLVILVVARHPDEIELKTSG
jgi:hypothetical protein